MRYFDGPSTVTNTFQVVIYADARIYLNHRAIGAVPAGDQNGITIGVQGNPKDGGRTYTAGTSVPAEGTTIVFAPYVEQTYGVAHVTVDAGAAVADINFGATRSPTLAFAQDDMPPVSSAGLHSTVLYTTFEHELMV